MNASDNQVTVFFSYVAEDLPITEEIEKHLYTHRQASSFVINSIIGNGDFRKNMLQPDIILVFLSKRYLSSKGKQEEMIFIRDVSAKGFVRVVLTLLEPCPWQESPLGQFPLLTRNTKMFPLEALDPEYMAQLLSGMLSVIELVNNTTARERIRQEQQQQSGILDLSECRLMKIPFDLLSMPWLHTLVLYDNSIDRIEHLDALLQLRSLSLASNSITVIEGLDALEALEQLDLQVNRIPVVEGLEHLARLEFLGISRNGLEKLDGIESLQQLKSLYASHNQIQSIEVLSQLPLLKRVVLTNNPITSIRPLLGHMRQGLEVFVKYSFEPDEKGIFIKDCSRLSEPSPEVIAQGRDAILKYFEESVTIGTRKLELVKLILIGNSRVGKTNLSEYLRTGSISADSPSTHLLDVQGWEAPFLVSEQGTRTCVNIFDFGGQDYYHDAHRMYYSHDTAYLLLWDTSSNKYELREEQIADKEDALQYEDFPLEYWLESIKYNLDKRSFQNYYARTGEAAGAPAQAVAPVLVIQNKIDLGEGALDQAALQQKYPNVKQFFNLSLREGKRIQVLQEVLSDYMNALNLSGRQLLRYEYELVEAFRMKSGDTPEVMSLQVFGERCRELIRDKSIVFNEDNAEILAQILNNTGIFFYDKHQEGGGNIYTNIRALNERIKAIMDVARRGSDKGIFHKQQLAGVEDHTPVLDLLSRNNSIIQINEGHYIAPQFLPLKPDDAIAFFLQAFTYTQVRYVYKAYFHKTLLLNLFARYLDKENIDTTAEGFRFVPFWRNGIIIKRDKGGMKEWVLVEFEKNREEAVGIVSIRTMKPFQKNNLEGEIERSLDELNEGWTVEKQVSVNSTDFFALESLKRKVAAKQFSFSKNGRLFSVYDFKQIVSFDKLPKKLFISYSSRNAEFIKRFVTHLDVLKANGDIEPWYDRMIDPGTKWDESIRREMYSSDVVIFLISPDFLATEYIMKTEIPLAIAQAAQSKMSFFFIQLQDCLWDRTELGNFQQTADPAVVNKNVITIGQPDNHEKWIAAIKGLERVMAGT